MEILRILSTALISSFLWLAASGAALAEDAQLCETFAGEYDDANKQLASTLATFARSAPQETVQELMELNARFRQVIVLQQMTSHGCSVPMALSSGAGYFAHALRCSLAEIPSGSEDLPPECDRSTWRSSNE